MSAGNMSWRRLTCRDDSSCVDHFRVCDVNHSGVARAGKAVEQSDYAPRSVSRPST